MAYARSYGVSIAWSTGEATKQQYLATVDLLRRISTRNLDLKHSLLPPTDKQTIHYSVEDSNVQG